MTVVIRSATATDTSACLVLFETLIGAKADDRWENTFEMLLDGKRGTIRVAEEDGRLLGVAAVSFNLAVRYGGEYCQLEELVVDGAARGKNVGGLLLQAMVDTAKARGCAEMGLYLEQRFEGNRPFYEKYGFEFIGSEMRAKLA